MYHDEKHSPGPWKRWQHPEANAPCLMIVDANGVDIATVRGWRGDPDHCEMDAALIASAPELLSILEELLGDSDKDTYGYEALINALNDDWRARACAAVKNARTPQAL